MNLDILETKLNEAKIFLEIVELLLTKITPLLNKLLETETLTASERSAITILLRKLK